LPWRFYCIGCGALNQDWDDLRKHRREAHNEVSLR